MCRVMLLKELFPTWPPAVTTEARNNLDNADLGDVVLSVKKEGTANGQMEVRLRNRRGVLYTVTLTIPEDIFQMVLFSIMRKQDMTLREVGNIEIS